MNLNDNDSNNDAVKRRRIASPPHHDVIGIFDIPDGALVHVTSYLAKPSIALLALSLTCESASWKKIKWNEWNKKVSPILAWAKVTKREPSSATRVIVSSHAWESIDFGEFGGIRGKNLKDDDIAGVLACINARKHLKALKIRRCVNITGRGLQPLSGSLVLEQIDLTHKLLGPEKDISALSESFVLPVLDSIINIPRNTFTLVHFPEHWREAQSPELHTLLIDYERLLESRRNPCWKCNSLDRYVDWMHRDQRLSFGIQDNTCYKCLKFFCYECTTGDEDDPDHLMLCACCQCKDSYCDDCVPMTNCVSCGQYVCGACDSKCPNCEGRSCRDCEEEFMLICNICDVTSCDECINFHKCEGNGCQIVQCDTCYEEHIRRVEFCEKCHKTFCEDCRYKGLGKDWARAQRGWESGCKGCIQLVSGIIGNKLNEERQEDMAKNLKLQQENEALRQENEELKAKMSGCKECSSFCSAIHQGENV